MPTIFSHAFFGTAIGSTLAPKQLRARFLILTALCAILPDLDVVSFVFRVSYASMMGHRGISHSITFAVLIGCLIAVLCFRGHEVSRWKLALYFSGATLSHPLLDMLTNGGLGVALLAPFSNERFFFPWRPVQVSPIGVGFFSERGVAVIVSELLWIWLPAVVIAAVLWLVMRTPVRDRPGNRSSDRPSLSMTSGEDV